VDSKPTKKKKVYGRDISRRSNVSRNDVCICPCVITPRGWTSLPGRGVFFFGVYSNKQINKKNLEYRRKFADFSTNFPGNSKSENPALCEWFMLKLLNPPLMKLLNPPLLIRTYSTTLEHKNTYMIHGMRGYQKKKNVSTPRSKCQKRVRANIGNYFWSSLGFSNKHHYLSFEQIKLPAKLLNNFF